MSIFKDPFRHYVPLPPTASLLGKILCYSNKVEYEDLWFINNGMKILNTFAKIDKIIKKIGTDNPEEVAAFLNYEIIFLTSSIVGYVTRIKNQTIIGINRRLSPIKKLFDEWHEIGHAISGHLNEADFTSNGNYHLDHSLFDTSQQFNSKTISRYEREANIIAAEYCIDSKKILEMTGYNNSVIQQFQVLKETQQQLRQEYERLLFAVQPSNLSETQKVRLNEYKNELARLDEKELELGSEISELGVMSIPEMAKHLHTSSIIVEYKLEAMRLRGYKLEGIELAAYNKVFKQEAV